MSDILIIGAGVLGLCVAAELKRRGRAVVVVDPGGPNASAIAAGMIAPAFESAAENASPDHAAFLRRARDLWPDFAAAHRLTLSAAPSTWRGSDAPAVAERLSGLGFRSTLIGDEVLTDEDLQIDPVASLQALALNLDLRHGTIARLDAVQGGWRATGEGLEVTASRVVIATGAAPAITGLPQATADTIDAIIPIRGQIGRVRALALDSVVRGAGAYVAPQASGALIGASMEPGCRGLVPDPKVSDRIKSAAEALLGQSLEPIEWRAGVRGATADGLPLAGPVGDGLHLALAPRRNGWLLGPLVARVVADGIEGGTPSPDAAALDPLRPIAAGR